MILSTKFSHLPFRLLQRLGSNIQIQIGHEIIVVPLHHPAALAWLYWRPNWKSTLIRSILKVRDGAFVDVGANVGQSLADFLSAGIRQPYLGFEPNVRCVAFLRELISSSQLSDADVLPLALAGSMGLRHLHFTSDSATDQTASLLRELRPTTVCRTEQVLTATLDEVLRDYRSISISLVKIDVEGAELEVLQGMTQTVQRERPFITCEVLLCDAAADRDSYARRIDGLQGLLREWRYRVFRCATSTSVTAKPLIEIDRFAVALWRPEQAGECDYLFVPEELPIPQVHDQA